MWYYCLLIKLKTTRAQANTARATGVDRPHAYNAPLIRYVGGDLDLLSLPPDTLLGLFGPLDDDPSAALRFLPLDLLTSNPCSRKKASTWSAAGVRRVNVDLNVRSGCCSSSASCSWDAAPPKMLKSRPKLFLRGFSAALSVSPAPKSSSN